MNNNNEFSVEILKSHPRLKAQVKKISTPHGDFITPVFMPVGTKAAVNALSPHDLKNCHTQIILGGNTYHMLIAPGLEVIQALGGMHRFMAWKGPMLTDSGGFQVFSLSKDSKICSITDQGAKFKHPHSGKILQLNPQTSIQAQKIIGADIIMAFDQCTPDVDDHGTVKKAWERTKNWLLASKAEHLKNSHSAYGYKQAFFGIIQGGFNRELRLESTRFTLDQDLDGIAVGGESIGFDMEKTVEILRWIEELIPKSLPLYTMGVGLHPIDLIQVVAEGADMFDCVAPTRNARHGSLYVGEIVHTQDWVEFQSEELGGKINIGKSMYAKDESPISKHCDCSTCAQYSRGYLHFLQRSKSNIYYNLACIHNVHVMNAVCTAMRDAIFNA